MNPIAAEEISVRYGRRAALDRVSLTVEPGEVYALLGANGAGKSSLVRCLLGAQRPAAGRALLFGRDAWRERAAVLAQVGVASEDPDAPRTMTVAELSRFCARLYPRWDAAGLDERLRRFGVPRDVPFGKLSRGQRGQVSLALALGHEPQLLILDDPTLGLDPIARRTVFSELIGELADRGTTVFLTTHDLAAVEGIAGRVGIVKEGHLVLDESIEALKARFRRIRFPAANGAPGTADAAARQAALADFAPVAVAANAWGVEAVVSRYDEAGFLRRNAGEGTAEPAEAGDRAGGASRPRPEVSALNLEEIFVAVVGRPEGGVA